MFELCFVFRVVAERTVKYLCEALNIVRNNGQPWAVESPRVGSWFGFRLSGISDSFCRLVRSIWRPRQDLAGARPQLAL